YGRRPRRRRRATGPASAAAIAARQRPSAGHRPLRAHPARGRRGRRPRRAPALRQPRRRRRIAEPGGAAARGLPLPQRVAPHLSTPPAPAGNRFGGMRDDRGRARTGEPTDRERAGIRLEILVVLGVTFGLSGLNAALSLVESAL